MHYEQTVEEIATNLLAMSKLSVYISSLLESNYMSYASSGNNINICSLNKSDKGSSTTM
jgi:hypothetical protein